MERDANDSLYSILLPHSSHFRHPTSPANYPRSPTPVTMLEKWLTDGSSDLVMVVISGVATYVAILLYTRLVGLRSFSKMSAADFAMTVAVGSLFASTISSPSPSLAVGLTAIAVLFFGQWGFAFLRMKSSLFSRWVDNEPLLLMRDGKVLDDNLKRANVTRNDLYAKLREANALRLSEVRAVVFETTGDISVLHSSSSDARLEPEVMTSVVGFETE